MVNVAIPYMDALVEDDPINGSFRSWWEVVGIFFHFPQNKDYT